MEIKDLAPNFANDPRTKIQGNEIVSGFMILLS